MTSAAAFRSPHRGVPAPRLDRGARLFLVGAATLVALVGLLLQPPRGGAIVAWDVLIVGLLAFNAQAFYSSRSYLFSSGFWTALFFAFYFVLKSTEYLDGDAEGWIRTVLMHCVLFLCFYNLGYFLSTRRRSEAAPSFQVVDGLRLVRICFAVFLLSRVLYYAAVIAVLGGEYNQLELVAGTQNQGMSYIFKAFSIGQLALFMLFIYGFMHRRHGAYVAAAAAVYLLDAVNSASRGALVVFVLILLFLYDRYARRVSWIWLAALAPPLVFIVSFFGYVRNIEVGSLGVYWDALQYFLDQGDVVWTLFLARLDLLPTVAGAMEAHAQGRLPSLWGASYVDMLLHFVPRNLWPSKPPLTAAYVTSVVAPGAFEDGVLIYPTIFLEGFLNFGLAGVGFAGVLVGAAAARYDGWMRDRGFGRTFYFLVFFTFPLGLIGEGVHSNFVATSLYTAALAWLLVTLLRRLGAIGRGSGGRAARPAAASG